MRHWFGTFFIFIVIFGVLSLTILAGIYPQALQNQFIFFALGLGVYMFAAKTPFFAWKKLAKPLYIATIILLIVTFFLGKTTKGSTRWIDFGVFQFQPSQLAKPIAALYLAGVVSSWKYPGKKQVIEFAVAAIPLFALIFIQPDLGTALVVMATCAAVFLFSRISGWWIIGIAGLALILAAIGWKFVLHDYQKERLQVFLAPQEDIQDSGYHANQALIAVGSGKIVGRGLGRGVQSNLRYLPERQTDFFFASTAEETGFMGSIVILALYGAFFTAIYKTSTKITKEHEKVLILAIFSMLAVQTLMNLGMNLGLLPVTGITLPLLSLGGTSIISICFSLGLVVSAAQAGTPRSVIELRSFL